MEVKDLEVLKKETSIFLILTFTLIYGQILFVAVAATILLGFKDWRMQGKW